MPYSSRQLNRATLHRQLLLERQPLDAMSAVDRVLAIQAQEPASPYLALWNRIAGFDATELDRAFVDRTIVKSTLLRVTLHATTAADQPVLYAAMRARLRTRFNDPRFRALGLTVHEADAVLADLAACLADPRSNAEIDELLRERLGELPKPGLWWALRLTGPVHHAPTGAPWSFGPRPSYVAAPPVDPPIETETGVRHFVQRYLEAFGPASVLDIAQFSLLLRPGIREATAALELDRVVGPAGEELFDVPGREPPDEDVEAPPRLMAMWDSVLLAHADRSRIIPPEYRAHVIRRNGDVLATVLVDGYVAGVWRPAPDGIEVTAFHPWSDQTWSALEQEARALRGFLADRDPEVYRRYQRWWETLPAAEVRVLGP